ncbi:hypothetical protein PMAYCL1PPCAC_22008, partial [Pristionchus mayeri]
LCEQGGYWICPKRGKQKIERGSAPPPPPPERQQITLNKDPEVPDSQSLFGSIRVSTWPAEPEAHRIGVVIEEMVLRGGFVPKQVVRAVRERDESSAAEQRK